MKPLQYLAYFTLSTILFACNTSPDNEYADTNVAVNIDTNKKEPIAQTEPLEILAEQPIDMTKIDSLFELGTTVSTSSIVQGNTSFAMDLFKQIQDKPIRNLVYSPYSISNAFAMLYGGAKEETADQIQKILHFPSPNTKSFHEAFAQLNELAIVESKDAITLRSANKLWFKDGFNPKDGFAEMTKAFYQSDLDFFKGAESGSQKINDWVSEQTNEKIQNIISPSHLRIADLVLANAIYFYGNWQNEFDPENTSPDTFFSTPTPVTTDFMNARVYAGVLPLDWANVLVLDYKDQAASMLIVLPNEEVSLEKVIPHLSAEKYLEWCTKIGPSRKEVYLQLPKWKITPPSIPLSDHFLKMGLDLPFNKGNTAPNFNNIAPNLFLSNILHKAMIEVNEKGAEAAAATTATVGTRGIYHPQHININRPFLYFIKDNTTESILFMGQVIDPSKSE